MQIALITRLSHLNITRYYENQQDIGNIHLPLDTDLHRFRNHSATNAHGQLSMLTRIYGLYNS